MPPQNNKQPFRDGIVKVYSIDNIAEPGKMPRNEMVLKETLRYEERTVGIKRYYTAKQDNAQIEHVLRCPRREDISAQDVAVLESGRQYEIEMVQYPDGIQPAVMDLTLKKVVQDYDIA